MITQDSKQNLTTQQSQSSLHHTHRQSKNTVIAHHSARAYIHPPVSEPNYHITNSFLTSLPNNQYCERVAQINGLNPQQKQKFIEIFTRNQANHQEQLDKINKNAQVRSYKQELQRKCFQNKVKRQMGNFPVLDISSLIRQKTQLSDTRNNSDRHNVNFFYSASVRNLNRCRSEKYLS